MGLNLNRLNAKQREAVYHGSGPLLILAGAGSGKTSTMSYRIAHLIASRNIPATDILGLSFTNKAAGELKERVIRLILESCGRKAARGLTITTFHSLCARVLRVHADRLGFQKNFTILDQNDQTDILKQVLRNIRIDDRKFDPKVILFQIGQAKNRFLRPDQMEAYFLESTKLSPEYALVTASSYSRYQDQLKILNAMDFDDLIYHTVHLLENFGDVRDQYNYRFRHILVDEYQDTNAAQFKILRLLTEKQENLCVVGDDDQSIYSWRGADPSHILGFNQVFPSAHVIALEQNYRSTSRILEAANSVIEKNRGRYPKKLWSDRGEGEPLIEVILEEDRAEGDFIAEEILRRSAESQRPWKDFAILYRSNPQSRIFEEALRRRAIPYRIVGGLSFLDRKEVKDVLAYWKLIVNPKDDASFRRVINWPARGIGKTSIETLGSHAFQSNQSIFDSISTSMKLSSKAALAVSSFQEMIHGLTEKLNALQSPEASQVAQWAKDSLNTIQAKRAVEEDCDDAVQAVKKWENVEELIHSIGQFKAETSESISGQDFLREFLNRMTLESQEAEKEDEKNEKDSQKNQVTLLTLHGAKGLEFPIVFLVGMEDGFLPHRRTIEEATDLGEERRLCYVGITRAKDFLFLTRTQNRIRYGKPVPRNRSRFLEEIPKELITRMNHSSTPDLSTPQAQQEHEKNVKNYLAEIRARLTKSPS